MNKLNIPISYEVNHLFVFLGMQKPVFWVENVEDFKKSSDGTRGYNLARSKKGLFKEIETNLPPKTSNEYIINKMVHVFKRKYLELLKANNETFKQFIKEVRAYFGGDYTWNNFNSLRYLFNYFLGDQAFRRYQITVDKNNILCKTICPPNGLAQKNTQNHGLMELNLDKNLNLVSNKEEVLQKCEIQSQAKEIMRYQMALEF